MYQVVRGVVDGKVSADDGADRLRQCAERVQCLPVLLGDTFSVVGRFVRESMCLELLECGLLVLYSWGGRGFDKLLRGWLSHLWMDDMSATGKGWHFEVLFVLSFMEE